MQRDVSDYAEVLCETKPRCSVFGLCGGCSYQDISYSDELVLKSNLLKSLMRNELGVDETCFLPIIASPDDYQYRSRLDMTVRRIKDGGTVMGFQSEGCHRLVSIESCDIALPPISCFLKELHRITKEKMPEKYRTANLVVKSGDDGRVLWGGIGRRSLVMKEEDYLWTQINGKRVFYSLDTFFQANLSILPKVMEHIQNLIPDDRQTVFYDLYAGVGLFGIYFSDRCKHVVMVEESRSSCQLMRFNLAYHHLQNAEVVESSVEEALPQLLRNHVGGRQIALIDPPRKGLSLSAVETVSEARSLEGLFYLSCHPESLVRDLKIFQEKGWFISRVTPFDFFPRTKHIETLVWLKPCR